MADETHPPDLVPPLRPLPDPDISGRQSPDEIILPPVPAPKPSANSMPYGPATPSIRKFLQRLLTLPLGLEQEVVAHYQQNMRSSEYRAAERVLGAAIARSGREAERDALAGPLLALVRADRAVSDATENRDAQSSAAANPTSLRPIAEPALAALLAILMQDVLAAEHVTQLYAPFEAAISRATL